MKIVQRGTVILAVLALFALPLFAGAQVGTDPGPAGPEDVEGLIGILVQLAIWIGRIFWILAGIFIIWAAFLYLTAGGDEDKVKKASQTFLYAVIAIAVAIFAQVLPVFIRNILDA